MAKPVTVVIDVLVSASMCVCVHTGVPCPVRAVPCPVPRPVPRRACVRADYLRPLTEGNFDVCVFAADLDRALDQKGKFRCVGTVLVRGW